MNVVPTKSHWTPNDSMWIHDVSVSTNVKATDEPEFRNLARLIVNDASTGEGDVTTQNMDYIPAKYVTDMHSAPRFGHSNRIGQIASSNHDDSLDYARGLKQFTLFVIIPFILWGILLLILKCVYGIQRVGCAAGGEILDMKVYSKRGISRKQRRRRILRSWRLQTTFMIVGVLIPTVSLLMMEGGWKELQLAWEDVQSVVDDVDALAYRGWNVVDSLRDTKKEFDQIQLVRSILDSEETGDALFASWCPNAGNEGDKFDALADAMGQIQSNTRSLLQSYDDHVPKDSSAFVVMTEVTESVDQSIDWFFDNDWIWKMYIMLLNVLNLLLFMACYIMTRNNVIHPPTRFYLSFVIVPMFTVVTVLMLIVTASTGVASLMNADFCAGGLEPGSPQGAIKDAILSYQYGTVERENQATGTLGLVYDSFHYYANDCLAENPLSFFDDYTATVDQVLAFIVDLSEKLPDNPKTVDTLNLECGADVSFLPSGLDEVETTLAKLQIQLYALVDLASCHRISPIVRRLTHGAICEESPKGLTFVWAGSLCICIFCFVLLTTRAALYNPTKRRKPRDHMPKRVVEKEFEDYKEFMAEYYDDTAEWKMGPPVKKVVEFDFGDHLRPNPTFETQATTKPSMDEEDDVSEQADMNKSMDSENGEEVPAGSQEEDIPEEGQEEDEPEVGQEDLQADVEMEPYVPEDISYDSSYESVSDDEDDEDSDDESAFNSFIAETRSIFQETRSVASSVASKTIQTIRRLRTIRPLLGGGGPRGGSSHGDEHSLQDESLYLSSPPPTSDLSPPASQQGEGLWSYITPTNGVSLFGSSRLLGTTATPGAPQKGFLFMPRVDPEAIEHEEDEMEPLTPCSKDNPSSPMSTGVRPRRLSMSPLLSPGPGVQTTPEPTFSAARRRFTAPSTPDLEIRRPRFSSEDSRDSSPAAPRPPEKAYRRLGRTRGGRMDVG